MRQLFPLEDVYRRAYDVPGVTPYPYQRALADDPEIDVVIALTGLGKTAAVTLGWAWRRLNQPDQTPRRLVWCLPMRTLVEQIAGEADTWMKRLAPDFEKAGQQTPKVHILMGGAVQDEWRLHPECPAILVGTQDMMLSRGLMRGYGMSRFGWPIDFGLLHADSLWVFDEVQLMGAGTATSAQMEAFRRRCGWRHEPAARSLWISATLEPEWLATVDFRREIPEPNTLRWDDGNPSEPPGLSARLDAGKTVRRAETVLTAAHEKAPDAYARALAAEVLRTHRSGMTTLVILNTVRRAQALYEALNRAGREKESLLLIHSRFRAPDRREKQRRLTALATTDRIVVATQAIEAGVDMTSAVLFTELAPWSSLVQRFGRCNRDGKLNDGGGAEIRWIDVEPAEACARPYDVEPLAMAREIVSGLSDAAPRRLPKATRPDPPKQVIRAGDFEQLFDTDADLSGYDLDVSPYIRDTDETAVSLFWRPVGEAKRVSQPRPERDELCSAPLGEARNWLKPVEGKPLRAYVEDPNEHEDRRERRKIRGWRPLGREERLRPGMVLLIDVEAGGYDPELGFVGDRTAVPVKPARSDAEQNPPGDDIGPGETTEDDKLTLDGYKCPVPLEGHLIHVETIIKKIAQELASEDEAKLLARAARWHDLGKAYEPFQKLLGRVEDGPLLAKSAPKAADQGAAHPGERQPGLRRYFRHELASALAFLDQHDGEPDADLIAYLIAAHHGKVRMGIRPLPEEEPEAPDRRIARGVQDGDPLPQVRCGDEISGPVVLDLGLMEMGEDEKGRPSWAARTQLLLAELGPFRLAYLEALLRIADWRASAAERRGELDNE
jgi:CRISPR-associated endonuclease/helicase Cas3